MSQKFLNHTSFRIADPKRSVDFYRKFFGLELLQTLEFKEQGVSHYLLGLTGTHSLYKDAPWYKRGGLLQLTHDHRVNTDSFVANNGNKEPHRGFGHICFSVANLEGTCKQLEEDGVKFQKRLTDGRQKNIAFALDPDGYWIEIISNTKTEADSPQQNTSRLNHSMIRVKDKEASLDFYIKQLGMSLVETKDFPEPKFTLLFLSFDPDFVKEKGFASAEGLIELTYNYGSETDESVKYHNGNTAPVGFSHLGISVDDPEALVKNLDANGVKIINPLGSSSLKNVATVADPDGYLIQIAPQVSYVSGTSSSL